MKPHTPLAAAALSALLALSTVPQVAIAADVTVAYQEIEETYGIVPGFFRLFAAEGAAEAWAAFKALQMNPDLGLDARTRELIGVALAAQGDCLPCVYFHVAAASANGASETEIVAAAALLGATQRLHTAFEQAGAERSVFAREVDLVLWGDVQTAERRRPTLDIYQLKSAPAAACD